MKKITYLEKTNLNPVINAQQQVTAQDLNQIKEVVNGIVSEAEAGRVKIREIEASDEVVLPNSVLISDIVISRKDGGTFTDTIKVLENDAEITDITPENGDTEVIFNFGLKRFKNKLSFQPSNGDFKVLIMGIDLPKWEF